MSMVIHFNATPDEEVLLSLSFRSECDVFDLLEVQGLAW